MWSKAQVHRVRDFRSRKCWPPLSQCKVQGLFYRPLVVSSSVAVKHELLFFIKFPPSCTEPPFAEERKPAPNTRNLKVRQTFLCQPTGKRPEGEVLVVLIWGTKLYKHSQGWVKVIASASVWVTLLCQQLQRPRLPLSKARLLLFSFYSLFVCFPPWKERLHSDLAKK